MENLIMTVTFVICLYTITSSKETCVDKDCVCKHETELDVIGTKPSLLCESKNLSLISKTLRSSSLMINGKFGAVMIQDKVSEEVNPYILGTLNVPMISLHLPKAQKMDTGAFSGQENNIETLVIFNTLLSKIPIAAIKNLEKLSELAIINAVNIEEIDEKCFHSLSPATIDSLDTFELHNSSLRSIGREAFSALTTLLVLRLTKGKLTTFPSGVLPSKQFIILYIGSNKFTDMQMEAFANFSAGSEISFRGNMISSTSLDAWNTIIQKRFVIRLYENPIKCDCNLMPFVKLSEAKKKYILPTMIYNKTGKVYESLCATPKYLEKRKMTSLTRDDMESQDCNN